MLDDVADYPLGEVYQTHYQWTDGRWRGPPLTGQHYCGTPEAWANGIPYSERPGISLNCCNPGQQPGRLRLRGGPGYPRGLLLCENGQFLLQEGARQGLRVKD